MENKNLDYENEFQRLSLFQKRIMTLSELSEYLGMAESYIYKLTSQKLIPYYQPLGKLLYFDRLEIEEWILSNPVHTLRDIERGANKLMLQRRRGKG